MALCLFDYVILASLFRCAAWRSDMWILRRCCRTVLDDVYRRTLLVSGEWWWLKTNEIIGWLYVCVLAGWQLEHMQNSCANHYRTPSKCFIKARRDGWGWLDGWDGMHIHTHTHTDIQECAHTWRICIQFGAVVYWNMRAIHSNICSRSHTNVCRLDNFICLRHGWQTC